jgi:hypothetical protein
VLLQAQLSNQRLKSITFLAFAQDHQSRLASFADPSKRPDEKVEPLLPRQSSDADDHGRSTIGEPFVFW